MPTCSLSKDITIDYKVSCGKVEILQGYIKPDTTPDLIIPSTIDSLPVDRISNKAFRGTPINSVTFPTSLSFVGTAAFSCCFHLTSVSLPGSISGFGYGVFSNCSNLQKVYIADGIQSVSSTMFAKCFNLKEVHLPNTLIKIEEGAFMSCRNLSSVVLPANLIHVGCLAFDGCNLSSLTFLNDDTIVKFPCFRDTENIPTIRCNYDSAPYIHFFIDERRHQNYNCEFKPRMSKMEMFFSNDICNNLSSDNVVESDKDNSQR